jgi:hypothetical protein
MAGLLSPLNGQRKDFVKGGPPQLRPGDSRQKKAATAEKQAN